MSWPPSAGRTTDRHRPKLVVIGIHQNLLGVWSIASRQLMVAHRLLQLFLGFAGGQCMSDRNVPTATSNVDETPAGPVSPRARTRDMKAMVGQHYLSHNSDDHTVGCTICSPIRSGTLNTGLMSPVRPCERVSRQIQFETGSAGKTGTTWKLVTLVAISSRHGRGRQDRQGSAARGRGGSSIHRGTAGGDIASRPLGASVRGSIPPWPVNESEAPSAD